MTGRPLLRPGRPNFSCGPCVKRPGWNWQALDHALLGRSHRAPAARAQLREVIERSKRLLGLPDSWRLAIMPGSDTGAMEAAMWSLLGPLPVDVVAFEHFSRAWAVDAVQQLRLPGTRVLDAPYGSLPRIDLVDAGHDLVFAWNGTSSGVRVPDAGFIAADRQGLAICDATSAVFAMELDWSRLDVVTWSWQKVLGGEAAHGMLALGPRAMQRLATHRPSWPVPKLFRMTDEQGVPVEAIFAGDTINTPSMMCVADALDALAWAERIGGVPAMIARAGRSAALVEDWVAQSRWATFLAEDRAIRSQTSICLRSEAGPAIAKLLEAEGVAHDIAHYRDAPPGLRIWAGATVEPDDIAALLPWLDWAHAQAA